MIPSIAKELDHGRKDVQARSGRVRNGWALPILWAGRFRKTYGPRGGQDTCRADFLDAWWRLRVGRGFQAMAIGRFLMELFGSGRYPLLETVEVFRPNAERSEQRIADQSAAAMAQYAAEFHARVHRTWIDAFADGLNRLVRPVVTLGLLYPIPATVLAPDKMGKVWLAIATLPAGYWAVIGIVLPFYFGGRMQVKALSASDWRAAAHAAAELAHVPKEENPALADWRLSNSG